MAGNKVSPRNLRLLYREGKCFREASFGSCPGYLQNNMVMLPEEYASDFDEFCRKNSAPCPLIYKSKVGEVGIPAFAENSDIRSDLSTYKMFENGEHTHTLSDLTDYWLKNIVSFYLGCSFSFDDKLIEKGILRNMSKNVAMYITNIKCHPVGVFSTNMVVSMRGVPKYKIQTAVEATINMDYAHGAPIHIGRPGDIGINNLENVDFGNANELNEDDVPMFWACGVTSSVAVQSAKLPLCFSHSPGCMFVADVLSDDVPNILNTKVYPAPMTICLDETYSRYSIISKTTWDILNKIEIEVSEDPGKRGIHELIVSNDYNKACLSLSKHSSHVGIALGFPCVENHNPSEENDGIAGAIYIARALMYLNKEVTFFVDTHSTALMEMLMQCFPKGILGKKANVQCVGADLTLEDTSHIYDDVKKEVKFSHLIAIERTSPSQSGKYFTMSGRDVSQKCDPIDILFEQAASFSDITTIGIGDGGNEVGMGKVSEKVAQVIPKGDVIASTVACDYLIVCGVSNWGGIALASGLFAVRNCDVHDRYQRNGIGFKNEEMDINKFLLTDEEDEALHKYILQQGFCDGISMKQVLTVDNLDYYDVHLPKLRKCRQLALS